MASPAIISINGNTLALSGVLDFDSVLEVDIQGQQWLQSAAPLECNLDLGGVSYSSSAGIVLLLGWLRVAQQQQKKLRIKQLPPSMAALAKVGGLEDLLV